MKRLLGKSLKSFLVRHYNEILFVIWIALNFILLAVFVHQKIDVRYYILLILVTGGTYHIVKKNKNKKALRVFYVSAILISIIVTVLLVKVAPKAGLF